MTDRATLLALADECERCGGLGWYGCAKAAQFPHILQLALSGNIQRRTCEKCDGTGRAALRARAEEDQP